MTTAKKHTDNPPPPPEMTPGPQAAAPAAPEQRNALQTSRTITIAITMTSGKPPKYVMTDGTWSQTYDAERSVANDLRNRLHGAA